MVGCTSWERSPVKFNPTYTRGHFACLVLALPFSFPLGGYACTRRFTAAWYARGRKTQRFISQTHTYCIIAHWRRSRSGFEKYASGGKLSMYVRCISHGCCELLDTHFLGQAPRCGASTFGTRVFCTPCNRRRLPQGREQDAQEDRGKRKEREQRGGGRFGSGERE